MRKPLLLPLTLLLLAHIAIAQKPKTIHLTGAKALQLISILASGGATGDAFGDRGAGAFVIHDLSVRTAATYKYDPDAPIYKLTVRSAYGVVGTATDQTRITEANALWEFFAGLDLPTDTAMEGSFFSLASVSCGIDTHADFASPKRAQCDLVNSF